MIELPSKPLADYIRTFGPAPIYIVAPPAGPAGTPCSINAARQLPSSRRIEAAWWAQTVEDAQHVVDVVLQCDLQKAERRGSMLAVTVPVASAAIASAARRLGIMLNDHAALLARSKVAVAELDHALEAARSSGVLRDFNAEYARQRRQAKAMGCVFMTYPQAMAKLRIAVAGNIAGTVAPGEIIRAVFNDAPRITAARRG